MTCRDAERWLDLFFDGELEGRAMRDCALHVTRCETCATVVRGHERVQSLLQRAVALELEELDRAAGAGPISLWEGIAGRLDEGAAATGGERQTALHEGRARPREIAGSDGLRRGGRRSVWPASSRSGQAGRRIGRPAGWAFGGLAVAAGAVLAVYVAIDGAGVSPGGGLVAGTRGGVGANGGPRTESATGSAVSLASQGAARSPTAVEEPPLPLVANAAGHRSNQIQIESMDYSGRSLAMWSEPGSETTVIWIDDDAQGPSAVPASAVRVQATRPASEQLDLSR